MILQRIWEIMMQEGSVPLFTEKMASYLTILISPCLILAVYRLWDTQRSFHLRILLV